MSVNEPAEKAGLRSLLSTISSFAAKRKEEGLSENKTVKIKSRDIAKMEKPIEELGYRKTLLYSFIQPAMILLFIAASVRHTGIQHSNCPLK